MFARTQCTPARKPAPPRVDPLLACSPRVQELKRSGHPAAQLLDLQSLLQQGRDPQQLLLEPGGS